MNTNVSRKSYTERKRMEKRGTSRRGSLIGNNALPTGEAIQEMEEEGFSFDIAILK